MVSRMDLIPDWNEGIGVIDDVMVLRVCAQLSQGHERGTLPNAAEIALDRMANEADKITAFLGGPLYDKLKSYCTKLGDQAVRGRTPAQLADEPSCRKALYVELDDEVKKTRADRGQRSGRRRAPPQGVPHPQAPMNRAQSPCCRPSRRSQPGRARDRR